MQIRSEGALIPFSYMDNKQLLAEFWTVMQSRALGHGSHGRACHVRNAVFRSMC